MNRVLSCTTESVASVRDKNEIDIMVNGIDIMVHEQSIVLHRSGSQSVYMSLAFWYYQGQETFWKALPYSK